MSKATEVIFHHYDLSPFSEKVRKVFAHKDMAWNAVEQPMWMPKPHLTPLTGGYRRIPVLQIGADVYCDTKRIIRKLDEVAPERPALPSCGRAAAEAVELWADRLLFQTCVPLVFTGLAAVMPPQLLEDRQKMRPDLRPESLAAMVPACRDELRSALRSLEIGLTRDAYILGDEFSIADAAVYHCLWFVRNDPASGAMLAAFPAVGAWLERIGAMGVGRPHAMEPTEALEIAKAASPAACAPPEPAEPNGLEVGMRVAVFSDDLPSDRFEGSIAGLASQEIVIRRETPELGEVAVHFPRAGYRVERI